MSIVKLLVCSPEGLKQPDFAHNTRVAWPVRVSSSSMDSCVRCLRDGGADGSASVVLLLDEVEGCYAGDAVLEQV